jgi:hypothetical protein
MHSNSCVARERRFSSLGELISGCCGKVLGEGGVAEFQDSERGGMIVIIRFVCWFFLVDF